MELQANFGLVCCPPIVWHPWRLGDWFSLLNHQDAKDAKGGFMKLSRLCGYKALRVLGARGEGRGRGARGFLGARGEGLF